MVGWRREGGNGKKKGVGMRKEERRRMGRKMGGGSRKRKGESKG